MLSVLYNVCLLFELIPFKVTEVILPLGMDCNL